MDLLVRGNLDVFESDALDQALDVGRRLVVQRREISAERRRLLPQARNNQKADERDDPGQQDEGGEPTQHARHAHVLEPVHYRVENIDECNRQHHRRNQNLRPPQHPNAHPDQDEHADDTPGAQPGLGDHGPQIDSIFSDGSSSLICRHRALW